MGSDVYFYLRKLIHLISGLLIVWYVVNRIAPILLLGICVFSIVLIDIFRIYIPTWNKYFITRLHPLLKDSEKRNNLTGASILWVSLYLAAIILPLDIFKVVAPIVAISDPLSAIAGKLLNKMPLRGTKTASGTIAFAIFTVIILMIVGNLPITINIILAILLAVIELYSPEQLENFSITFSAAFFYYCSETFIF